MSSKLLCFGEDNLLKKFINKLRGAERGNSDDEIVVDNIEVKGKTYLTFSITNHELIASQATGTSSLLYFLDPAIPMYEQKEFFLTIINERAEFEGLPVVIICDKDQRLNIKEIVNYFELFKIKDRASMIREIDLEEDKSFEEIFTWIDGQGEFRRTRTFDAPPKIVKMKPKYREAEPESTETKYDAIIRDKKLKGVGVKVQEEAYIDQEKERIKNENMQKQLANFSKNKKKMAPYDIKATPNPKIEANLHFFLKDGRVEKTPEANIKIQTDDFRDQPKEKSYIPKKTGVNISTQIEPTELFDFAHEVQPILDILITRALETAALEIEEEEEMLKIRKYKNAYSERVKKQGKHEQEIIDKELQAIKEKERILEAARKREQTKKEAIRKQLQFSIANTYLQNIYKDSAKSLYNKNFYPNEITHAIKTDYLPEILKKSMISYQRIIDDEKCLQNVFEESCVKPIQKAGKNLRMEHKKHRLEKEERRVNKGIEKRSIHIFYESDHKKFSSFAKYIEKSLSGTFDEYLKSREEEIQQIEEKLNHAEAEESEVHRVKEKDNDEYSLSHKSAVIGNDKIISFEVTENKFCPPVAIDNFTPCCLEFDKEGNQIETITPSSNSTQYIRYVSDLRYKRDLINFDRAAIIDLQKVPEKVNTLVFYLKISNIKKYLTESELKNIKNSSYQMEFYGKTIPIFKSDIGATTKWESLSQPQEAEPEENERESPEESVYFLAYNLTRINLCEWSIEELNCVSKILNKSEEEAFITTVNTFYKRSLDIFKVEEEEAKPPKLESPNSKRRSKKSIMEEKSLPKIVIEPPKLPSKVLKEIEINLSENWESLFNKLSDEVIDWKEFIEDAPDGWCLEFRGKQLENVEQLRKYKKVGDIKLKKIKRVVEIEKEEIGEGEGEGEEGNEEN